MLRALLRLAAYPPAIVLHLVCLNHRDRSDRFVADDGAPGPYHDRGARSREALAAAWAWWSRLVTFDVVVLSGALWIVLGELVIRRGCREGWWPVLGGYLRDALSGRY
ncbi:hypothetical protein [Paludisphaera sp.]|uniref:hypothetical protein n=1 Tax=Paludisphaera sp. TaxID=2017432 RepID=UPI00301D1442